MKDNPIKKGDIVRIPTSTPGHDGHKPKDTWVVVKAYDGGGYLLKGSTSIWPASRMVKR